MLPLLLAALSLLQPGHSLSPEPIFTAVTHSLLPPDYDNNPVQLNYGVAVTDVDSDGDLEIVVAGFNGPNLVLKYDKVKKRLQNIAVDERSSPYYSLRDRQGNAIGVAACDIDGDGREEIYFLNTNNAFAGVATYTDKLFKFRNGRWEDILSDDINVNRQVANHFAGRSVACVDRKGSGKYSVYVANYASGNIGPHALIEMDEGSSNVSMGIIALSNVAAEAGVNKYTGGRGVAVGPIVSSHNSDIFCDNENGPNFLFRNNGDGSFTDIAAETGIDDPQQHGRGLALADFNRDGKVDIVYGNWMGPHRFYLQASLNGKVRFRLAKLLNSSSPESALLKGLGSIFVIYNCFQTWGTGSTVLYHHDVRRDYKGPAIVQLIMNIATQAFALPSPVRTVIAADFDNDQELEVFFNNIAYRGSSSNRIFRVSQREGADPLIEEVNVGDAAEPSGQGTGAVATDFDGDGKLDLIIAHGESRAQPLSVYRVTQGSGNSWLRVIPRTSFGAFARGAKVVVYTRASGLHLRIIDGGSGYLCEMEPVAHFGLGKDVATHLEVTWPGGSFSSRPVAPTEINSTIEVPFPQEGVQAASQDIECGRGFTADGRRRCTDEDECARFPRPCPSNRPTCINTFGGYRCLPNRRCSRGYEPNEDGTACVAQVAYFGGGLSSSVHLACPLYPPVVLLSSLVCWLRA